MTNTQFTCHTNKHYLLGFILALLLTLMAFGLIGLSQGLLPQSLLRLTQISPWLIDLRNELSRDSAVTIIGILAILQVFVHLHYFLHLNWKLNNNLKNIALGFTLLILIIIVMGSIWVMADLDHMMMSNLP